MRASDAELPRPKATTTTVSSVGRQCGKPMTPAEKRKKTIIERYGSYKQMLAKRDPRDLILGGYNGGVAKTAKGFSKWEEGELSQYAKKRERDSQGRFLPKNQQIPETEVQTNQQETRDGGVSSEE